MKRLLTSAALAVATLCAVGSAQAAIVFTLSAPKTNIAIGESLEITGTLSGLGDKILSGYDLNFLYNSAILDWSLVTVYGVLGANWGVATNGLPDGDLGFNDASKESDAVLAATQANELLMFTFIVVGEANGFTSFGLGPEPDYARNFAGFTDPDYITESLAVQSNALRICVGECDNRVPEPESYGLAGMALLAAGLVRRRKARA